VGVVGVVSGTESGRVWLARNWRFESVDYPRRTELSVENLIGGELVVPRGGVAEAVIRVARRTSGAVADGSKAKDTDKRQTAREMRGTVSTGDAGDVVASLPTPEVVFRPARAHSLRPVGDRTRPNASWHRLAVRDVLEPFVFQVRADDARSSWIAVRLVDPPRLISLELAVIEPAYAGGATVVLPPGQGPYRVLRGSSLRIAGKVSSPLQDARVLTGQRDLPLAVEFPVGQRETPTDRPAQFQAKQREAGADSGGFSGVIPADQLTDGLLSFVVRDEHGLDFPRSPTVRLEWLDDAPPSVAVAWMGASRLVVPGGTLEAEVDVKDDRKVTGLRLLARVAAPSGEKVEQPWAPWPRVASKPVTWPVSGAAQWTESLRLDPALAPIGSVVTLVYEATDNDTVSGPKSSRSAEKSLRVVEPGELRGDWLRREKEIRQQIEQLADDLSIWGEQPESPRKSSAESDGERSDRELAAASSERQRERDLERYGTYRSAAFEHHVSLMALWQEMRFSGLEPSGKKSAADRLSERVLAPLNEVFERRMPAVIEILRRDGRVGELSARHALVVEGLRNVARELARAEGFQEAVRLVEELQDGQRAVLAETLEAERRRVRELLDRPAGR
ncbi:MAG: hypothetical protein ACKO38_18980, partial [Planctomycetota bacterium]